MSSLVYFGLTLIIAVVDTLFKQEPWYTVTNIALRIVIILPLIFAVIKGRSQYADLLRRTLWVVIIADSLLPVVFPAGMIAFLIVHILNSYNFYQHVELARARLASVIVPAVIAFGVALALYVFTLLPALDELFSVLVGVYLVPIALAWSLSITSYVQSRTRWARAASLGMLLFFLTDYQVAVEFLTKTSISYYGLINAVTYYAGLFLMSHATRYISEREAGGGNSVGHA